MDKLGFHKQPVHGLNIEDTLLADDADGVHHLARYWWARDLIPQTMMIPGTVFDLGCGCGYGSRILIESPHHGLIRKVAAVDLDARSLAAVRNLYGSHPGIQIIEAALDQFTATTTVDWAPLHAAATGIAGNPHPGGAAGIVAFELFEALRHRDVFLHEVTRLLRPDGTFCLNARHLDHAATVLNPRDAVIHYDRTTLETILRRHFGYVEFLCDRGPSYVFLQTINTWIADYVPDGTKPFDTGLDLILCRKPIKSNV